MKFVILLCVLSVLLLQQAQASPVKLVERQERGLARQQATNEVAPAAVQAADEDDDDEDDDDDEPDLGDLIDDDDDEEDDDDDDEDDDDEEEDRPQGQAAPNSGADDDDEEDDDDDDYLDRLFDDILGDEDDDEDDDDDEPAAASVQNTVAAAPAQAIEEIAPAGQSAAAGISDGVDLPAESVNAIEPVAAGNTVDSDVAPSSSSNNEGSLKNNIIDMSSDAFQERNNQFVDAIFARINRIVSDNYDPFVVQLNGRSTIKHDTKSASTSASGTAVAATSTKSQQNKIKTAKPQTTNTSIKKLKNTKSEPRSNTNNDDTSNNNDENISNSNTLASEESSMAKDNEPKQLNKLQQQLEQLQGQQQKKLKATEEQIEKDVVTNEQQKNEKTSDEMKQETRTAFANDVVKSGNQKKSSTKAHKQHSATKKVHNAAATHNNNVNKQKLKSTTANNVNKHGNSKDSMELLKAEGSLSGLASLKRVGNVKLATDPEGRNSTIKAKFTLGPLILRVEKSFKRAGVENVKSATARTNEMIGRIKFGVVNDRATLMSIKVQQPKQVEVESKDNHDRTREFVWRRTPKIAKLVNEKLKLAAETLFAPQGVEVVRL